MKMFRVVVNGSEYRVGIEELADEESKLPAATARLSPAGGSGPASPATASAPAGRGGARTATGGVTREVAGAVRAPLPGTILQVAVRPGDTVSLGQTLLVLEAMKMENEIKAPAEGLVAEVPVSQGDSVNAGDLLVLLTS